MIFFGIDYSITSPAICALDESKNIIEIQCLSSRKKDLKIDNPIIKVLEYPKEYKTNIERFDILSNLTIEFIKKHRTENSIVFLEGYAYGATGSRVFQLAENGGILKLKIEKENLPLYLLPPTQVKKGLTGRGTANKIAMYDTFYNLYPHLNLVEIFSNNKTSNPISDISDSVLICLFGIQEYKNGGLHRYTE